MFLVESDVDAFGIKKRGRTCAIPDEGEIAKAQDWLFTFAEKTAGIRKRVCYHASGSYGLKHLVEKWYYQTSGGAYISNGAFIVAAIRLGYKAKPDCSDRYTPNAYFAMTAKAWDRREKAIGKKAYDAGETCRAHW